MKARVKATGEIVCVFCEPMIGGDGYAFYTEDRDRYLFDDLDFNIPDYWTRLEHQYAGMAMAGICANPSYDEASYATMADDAIRAAHALVEKLKEKEERK